MKEFVIFALGVVMFAAIINAFAQADYRSCLSNGVDEYTCEFTSGYHP